MSYNRQIIFIERVLWAGGAEKVVYDLAHGLDRNRFEAHVVCLFEQQNIPISFAPDISIHFIRPLSPNAAQIEGADEKKENVKPLLTRRIHEFIKRKYVKWEGKLRRFLRFESAAPLQGTDAALSFPSMVFQSANRWWPYALGLQQILKNFRADALLVPIMEEATIVTWLGQLLERRPFVASLHSVESYNMKLIYPDPARLLTEEWMFASACRGSAQVTVPSNGCRDDLIKNYGVLDTHIRVVSNPVNAESIQSRSKESMPPFASKARTKFAFVGRLDQDKNPLLLLEAAHWLRKSYNDFAVYYAGKGALYDDLQRQIRELGLQEHVFLLGEMSNPYTLMAHARALVLTSQVESFALALVEAMLCGAVPIAVDCPFGPREILDDGKYGLLTPADDPQALAGAMYRIASDDCLHAEFRELGSQRAMRYDISKVILEWEQIFGI
jgi:glycosyltransferase involved in cell wall biosynthesis